MKHIALRYDFVREQVRLGTIRIEHLHTTKMTADTLTKPLDPLLFAQHAIRLLNTSPPDSVDLEAYQLSLCPLAAKSAKRISIIRLSNVHLMYLFVLLNYYAVEFVGPCSYYTS